MVAPILTQQSMSFGGEQGNGNYCWLQTSTTIRRALSRGAALRFELSPPDSSGKWFLAVAHAPPSCRFAPAALRYKILRPGASPDKPITLLDRRDLIDPSFEPPFRIRTEEDWFALTRGKQRKLDGERGIAIARYEVTGEQIRRIHPLALSPEDFLDEWVQLDWEEAVRWSKESNLLNLQNWHSKLSGLEFDSTELRVVQPCPTQRDLDKAWLIGLWIDRQMNPKVEEEEIYIHLAQKNGIYYVDSIETNRPTGCPGNSPPHQLEELKLPSW